MVDLYWLEALYRCRMTGAVKVEYPFSIILVKEFKLTLKIPSENADIDYNSKII
jgi:hypothetical protein